MSRNIAYIDQAAQALTTAELLASLHHESPLLRGRAAVELSKRFHESEDIFPHLLATVRESANRTGHVLGLITVSWIAAIAILENGSEKQLQSVNQLIRGWDATEQEDFQYHVRHAGLPLDLN